VGDPGNPGIRTRPRRDHDVGPASREQLGDVTANRAGSDDEVTIKHDDNFLPFGRAPLSF
jgi:hypothetical protein